MELSLSLEEGGLALMDRKATRGNKEGWMITEFVTQHDVCSKTRKMIRMTL